MAGSFLKRVMREKRSEVEKLKRRVPQNVLLQAMLSLPPVRNFRESILRAPAKAVIAEIKRKAPGAKGWKPVIRLERLVKAYEEGGALAISCVTEEKYFGGDLKLIAEVKQFSSVPVLRKDFIVDAYQLYQSRAARADAVLLLAESLSDKDLRRFIELTITLGMTPVVEVHAAPDIKRALRAGGEVILINNRDLNTLKVNRQTVERLAKTVPKDIWVIAASGYSLPEEVAAIGSDRVRAVLVGRALLDHKHPDQLISQMIEAAEKV